MRAVSRKAIVLLLLGGYSVAVTVGGAFHTHLGGGCCSEESGAAQSCHAHVCDAEHTHGTPNDRMGASHFPTLERFAVPLDAHCPICSFLAQKPIPVVSQAVEDSTDLEQSLARVKAIPPSDDIPSTVFSRGPPSIA